MFEEETSKSIDNALDFAIAPISPQIAVTSFSKGLKIGPIAALFYTNDIRLNYEQYAGNDRNIFTDNVIDNIVLVVGVGFGELLGMLALPGICDSGSSDSNRCYTPPAIRMDAYMCIKN